MEYGQKPATIRQYIAALGYPTWILGSILILLVLGCVVYARRDDIRSFQKEHHQETRESEARLTAAETNIKTFETALDSFQVDNGRYPNLREGLQALLTCPAAKLKATWTGPYVASYVAGIQADPWGNPYKYFYPPMSGIHHPFDLISAGPDGVFYTDDDITND